MCSWTLKHAITLALRRENKDAQAHFYTVMDTIWLNIYATPFCPKQWIIYGISALPVSFQAFGNVRQLC